MVLKIEFSNYAKKTNETLTQRLQFVYSPLNELFRSLHVLLNPRHHGTNIDWALTSQAKLSKDFYHELDYFSPLFELGVSPLLLCNFKYHATSLDDELRNLKNFLPTLPPKQLLTQLSQVTTARENAYIPTLAQSLEWQDFTLSTDKQLLIDLAQDSSHVYQRLFAFIATYRNAVFDETWRTKNLQHKLITEIRRQALYLQQNGLKKMFAQLQVDRIHWDNEQLVIVKPFEQTLKLAEQDTIMLLPSYFIWPHLFAEPFQHGIAVTYDITKQPSYYDTTPAELVTIFKALSDPVRLQIINYVKERPCTTQALAQILLLSPSSVSRHLQLLKDAKLLTTTKVKKFVLYEPTELVTQLMPAFYRFLQKGGL